MLYMKTRMVMVFRHWHKFGLTVALMLMMWVGASTEGLAAPKKTQTVPKETITYVVQKGDSVEKIARKYEVSANDIVKWNNLADAAKIKIGQKLRLRVPKSVAVAQAVAATNSKSTGANAKGTAKEIPTTYTVKNGDNLGKISRKTGVSIEDLKKFNPPLKKNPDKLRVGQVIKLSLQPAIVAGKGSVSHGLANSGYLTGGIQMPKGKGYVVRNPKRSYGTATTVSLIQGAMAAYAQKYPKGPTFTIGDLSVQKGGRLSPHLSHQSGRDVDITMVRKPDGSLDIEKNWYLIEQFFKTKKVQYIFLDYNLQKGFYDYAISHGYSAAQLKTMIQYPNGMKSYWAILRHSKGHIRHIHVRFVCAPTDMNCR